MKGKLGNGYDLSCKEIKGTKIKEKRKKERKRNSVKRKKIEHAAGNARLGRMLEECCQVVHLNNRTRFRVHRYGLKGLFNDTTVAQLHRHYSTFYRRVAHGA
jgi:hypothetical protein